jgi:FlaA1/EpsC-like NDP-sugar epimerase
MKLRKFLSQALLSRFLILSLDLVLVVFSLGAAYLLRFNFRVPPHVFDSLPYTVGYVLLIRLIPFYFLKTYAGLIKYTGEQDIKIVLRAITASTVFFVIVYTFLRLFELGDKFFFFYPLSIILIDYLLLSFILVGYRITIKIISEEIKSSKFGPKGVKKNVAIFGAGQSGLFVKKAIEDDKGNQMTVVAWLDDNPILIGKSLEGKRIYHAKNDLVKVIQKFQIDTIIMSMQLIDPARKQRFVDACLEANVNMLYTPPVKKWLKGELNVQQLKKFNIEDVLDREPIVLDNKYLEFQIAEKVVLITGAAGSIGSEIVRQLVSYQPATLVLVDVAESPLVELGLEIEERFGFQNLHLFVGDVSNANRMERVFKEFQPEIVYHAAAYKHVPVMEHTPYEAVRVNILGTKTIADLSVRYKAEKFVMISTDKAVNPTNVMGCSKRVAEIYTQSLSNHLKEKGEVTRFITTRFGNVLGSNGSVIPRFQKQMESGGPITVTAPDITRFFMTIPEACQLVLEAGAMGKGGEIFIFDMGKPVRIVDMAEKMIKLAGKIPYKDIDIVFTGLRPGEKLEEELLAKKENIMATHHQKIMKAKVREYNFVEVKTEIESLIALLPAQNDADLVMKMKMLVPEYISNNSVFEDLDRQTEGIRTGKLA